MQITLYITIITIYALFCAGGRVVHSYGRLIPHEFPITDLQQISGPDGIGRVTCTVSSGTAEFVANGGQLEGGGVTRTRNGATATLVVNPSNVDSFQNRGLYCTNIDTSFFYLSLSSASKYTYSTLQVHTPLFSQQVLVLGNIYLKCYPFKNVCCVFPHISNTSKFPQYTYYSNVLYKAKQCIPNS